MRSSILVGGAVLLLVSAGGAAAETLSKTVQANTVTVLDLFMNWGNDCRSLGRIASGFSERPSHGAVIPAVVTTRIPGAADIGSTASCAGKPIQALRVSYRPRKGYRGPDRLTVWVKYGPAGTKTYTYDIQVQ